MRGESLAVAAPASVESGQVSSCISLPTRWECSVARSSSTRRLGQQRERVPRRCRMRHIAMLVRHGDEVQQVRDATAMLYTERSKGRYSPRGEELYESERTADGVVESGRGKVEYIRSRGGSCQECCNGQQGRSGPHLGVLNESAGSGGEQERDDDAPLRLFLGSTQPLYLSTRLAVTLYRRFRSLHDLTLPSALFVDLAFGTRLQLPLPL